MRLNLDGVTLFAAFFGALGLTIMVVVIAQAVFGLSSLFRGKAGQRLARLTEKEKGKDPYRLSALDEHPLLERLLGPTFSSTSRAMGALVGSADRDAALLLQAGHPRPFYTLGDFYGWKVISAFVFFVMALVSAAVTGAAFFVLVAFALGVFGLYLPDLTLHQAAQRRQEDFRAEMAFALDRLAMMLGAGDSPEMAVRRIGGRSGGLFVFKMREVRDGLNRGNTLGDAMQQIEEEFPVEEYRGLVDAIALGIEQGSPLKTTLGDMADNMLNDIENELLGKGLRSAIPMVFGMGIGLVNIFILIGAPLVALWLTSP
jgi:hypothetical protein